MMKPDDCPPTKLLLPQQQTFLYLSIVLLSLLPVFAGAVPDRCRLGSLEESISFVESSWSVPFVGTYPNLSEEEDLLWTTFLLQSLFLGSYNEIGCGYRSAEHVQVSVDDPQNPTRLLFNVSGTACEFCTEEEEEEEEGNEDYHDNRNLEAFSEFPEEQEFSALLQSDHLKSPPSQESRNNNRGRLSTTTTTTKSKKTSSSSQGHHRFLSSGKGKGGKRTDFPTAAPSFSDLDVCPVCAFDADRVIATFALYAQGQANQINGLPGIQFVGETAVDCPNDVEIFTADAQLSFGVADDAAAGGQEVSADDILQLEDAFVSTYNGLTFSLCDESFRTLTSATFTPQAFRRLQQRRKTLQSSSSYSGATDRRRHLNAVQVTSDYKATVNGTCRRCSSNTALLTTGRRRRQLQHEPQEQQQRRYHYLPRGRHLQLSPHNSTTCSCAVDSSLEGRAPTLDEFELAYSTVVTDLAAAGDLTTVLNLDRLDEIDTVTSAPLQLFGDTLYLTFAGGNPAAEEIATLEAQFVESYNELEGDEEFCDPFCRTVVSASFEALAFRRYRRHRQLAEQVTADYKCDVNGTCRRCPSGVTLFGSSSSRNLLVGEQPQRRQRHRRVQDSTCVCTTTALQNLRSPTLEEFGSMYGTDVNELFREGEIASISDLLSVSDTAPPTESPTVMPTTSSPTAHPVVPPTLSPTFVPTSSPTSVPATPSPTFVPTSSPTSVPATPSPTSVPATLSPTSVPATPSPTAIPITPLPTVVSTAEPTATEETQGPSATISAIPSALPSLLPSIVPTIEDTTLAPVVAPISATCFEGENLVEVSYEDFEDGDIVGWTNGKFDSTYNATFTNILGPFRFNDALTSKTFSLPSSLNKVFVTFVFFEIDSWDGDGPAGNDTMGVNLVGDSSDSANFGWFQVNIDEVGRSGVSDLGAFSWSISSTPTRSSPQGYSDRSSDQEHMVTLEIPQEFFQNSQELNIEMAWELTDTNEIVGIDNVRVIGCESST